VDFRVQHSDDDSSGRTTPLAEVKKKSDGI